MTVIWVVSTSEGEDVNAYLAEVDVDARDGWGSFSFTSDLEAAEQFDDFVGAWEYWRRVSTVRPIRADGKPNRPGTALTITVLDVDRLKAFGRQG